MWRWGVGQLGQGGGGGVGEEEQLYEAWRQEDEGGRGGREGEGKASGGVALFRESGVGREQRREVDGNSKRAL